MKNLLLTLALSVGCLTYSSAQVNTVPQHTADVGMAPIKKGNWMIGGSVGSLGYSFESESFNIQVNPRAGYFISDGIAVGAQANLSFRTSDGENDARNQWGYGIAPFVRYYFPGGASASGRFFGQGDIGIGGSSAGDNVSLNLGLNAGYAHFITQTVALEVMAGYNYSKANINSDSNKQSGLGVAVGFQIYLPGKNR